MEKIYKKMLDLAIPYYEKGRVYDIPHIKWMIDKILEIPSEENLNLKLLMPIVILHDTGYSVVNDKTPNLKNKDIKKLHMKESAIIAKKILGELNYDRELSKKIIYYVSVHDNWCIGDDTPYKECKEMAIFNDLDFISGFFNEDGVKLWENHTGVKGKELIQKLKAEEKLIRRPFACNYTKELFTSAIKWLESRD